jgi:hypothetical protein
MPIRRFLSPVCQPETFDAFKMPRENVDDDIGVQKLHRSLTFPSNGQVRNLPEYHLSFFIAARLLRQVVVKQLKKSAGLQTGSPPPTF